MAPPCARQRREVVTSSTSVTASRGSAVPEIAELLIPGPSIFQALPRAKARVVASLRSCRYVPQDLNDLAFQVIVPTTFAIALQDRAALYRQCDRLVQLWLWLLQHRQVCV